MHGVMREISQNVKQLSVQGIRQEESTLGNLSLLPGYICNAVNIMYQKSLSVTMPKTPDLMPTQGAWNA